MKKICFIVGAFPKMQCGIGDYTYNLARELSKNGNEVSVITSKKAENDIEDNVKVYNIVEIWNFRNLNNIIEKLKEIQPDIVNIQYPSGEYKKNLMINFLPFFIRKKVKCKVVETIHEYSIFTILGKIRNAISFKFADEILAVEESYLDEIRKVNKKVEIKYLPISANVKKSNLSTNEIKEIRQKLGIQNCKVMSFFGFANENKGIENILYSLKDIPDVKLLFIGDVKEENAYQKSLIELSKKIGVYERIIFLGFVNQGDAGIYLKSTDVCVLPFVNGVSNRNGSYLAALNENIPVVTTTKSESYEKDGVFYVNINKKEELTSAIKKALNYNKEIKRENITWEWVAKKYLELI